MRKEDKKEYAAPRLTAVCFHAERGFAASEKSAHGLTNRGSGDGNTINWTPSGSDSDGWL